MVDWCWDVQVLQPIRFWWDVRGLIVGEASTWCYCCSNNWDVGSDEPHQLLV